MGRQGSQTGTHQGWLLPAQRGPGELHSRPAPVPVDRSRAGQNQGRVRRATRQDRGLDGHPRTRGTRTLDHQGRADRHQRQARHPAPHRPRARRGRHGDRGSHRQRRCHHHPHPQRPNQAHQRQLLPLTTPWRQGRDRHGHAQGLRRAGRSRGFYRAPLHRQHARLPHVLHQHRPRLRAPRA